MTLYPGKNKSTESEASILGGGLERKSQAQATNTVRDRQINQSDVTMCIIHCKKHRNYSFEATSGEDGSSFFFPIGSTIQGKDPVYAATTKVKQFLAHAGSPGGYAPFQEVELVQTFVTKAPVSKKTLTRYTFYTFFKDETCCTSFPKLNWLELKEVKASAAKFWGPECWLYPLWFESSSRSSRIHDSSSGSDHSLRKSKISSHSSHSKSDGPRSSSSGSHGSLESEEPKAKNGTKPNGSPVKSEVKKEMAKSKIEPKSTVNRPKIESKVNQPQPKIDPKTSNVIRSKIENKSTSIPTSKIEKKSTMIRPKASTKPSPKHKLKSNREKSKNDPKSAVIHPKIVSKSNGVHSKVEGKPSGSPIKIDLKKDEVTSSKGPAVKGESSDSHPKSDFKKTTELSIDKFMPLFNSEKMLMHSVLKGLNVDLRTYRLFFNDYCQSIWPSREMSLHSFAEWSVSVGFLKRGHQKIENVFRAFCSDKSSPTITFVDFISGLALMDPSLAIQDPLVQEIRLHYIFRFYSSDGVNISYDDYTQMMKDTRNYKAEDLAPIVKQFWADHQVSDKGISRSDFIQLGLKLEIKGTTNLLKSGFELRKNNRFIHFFPTTSTILSTVDISSAKSESSVNIRKEGVSLGKHLVNLMKDFVDHHSLMKVKMNQKDKYINYLDLPKKETIGSLVNLCDRVEELLKREERMIRIKSPTCVFGDLHGNIHDLMSYDRMFFSSKNTSNYTMLFLGDYVDRGAFSLEVCIYLFALKIMEPTKYFLLRGNHEVRLVNRGFTFYTEIMSKFPEAADFLWERFNQVFDYLPICALVDDTTFCAHGGIPSSKGGVSRFEDFLKIPLHLPDPEGNPFAWEMLWNDPIDHEMFGELMDATRQISGRAFTHDLFDNGFVINTKRGTAMFWSLQACERFVKENKIKRVVRAHEVCMDGFQSLHNNLTWTVFSSSHYGGSKNKAGVVVITGDKFKPIKLELDDM